MKTIFVRSYNELKYISEELDYMIISLLLYHIFYDDYKVDNLRFISFLIEEYLVENYEKFN